MLPLKVMRLVMTDIMLWCLFNECCSKWLEISDWHQYKKIAEEENLEQEIKTFYAKK